MSKTLDSASAHFAASAVVSAPVPGRSEVVKEQNTGHSNINGVVQPSGTAGVSLEVIPHKLEFGFISYLQRKKMYVSSQAICFRISVESYGE